MNNDDFNRKCAEIMEYLFKDGKFYQYDTTPDCRISYDPYNDLNQLAEVVEKIGTEKFTKYVVANLHLSVTQLMRDFVEAV